MARNIRAKPRSKRKSKRRRSDSRQPASAWASVGIRMRELGWTLPASERTRERALELERVRMRVLVPVLERDPVLVQVRAAMREQMQGLAQALERVPTPGTSPSPQDLPGAAVATLLGLPSSTVLEPAHFLPHKWHPSIARADLANTSPSTPATDTSSEPGDQ